MKILVIGGGGREHAIVWKLAQSPKVQAIFCAPGNPGMAGLATCLTIDPDDIAGLKAFALDNHIDLTVVGPEAPLVAGLTDVFEQAGLLVAGPSAAAARLEGSKAFAKEVMEAAGVPTAQCRIFDDAAQAKDHCRNLGGPVVVKADGLAAGKGVIMCRTAGEAMAACERIMEERAFGQAGERVVIEEWLEGEEASFLVFTDGQAIAAMPSSQDHKAVGEGDTGPNTGGMGAYSPAPVVGPALESAVIERVIKPTLAEMKRRGAPFKGVLYAGLMIDKAGEPKVLEFNVRFGDPECQPLLMRLDCDLAEILQLLAQGRLAEAEVKWKADPAVCVVLASGGYPGDYAKGFEISGVEEANAVEGARVFHAGTALKDGKLVNAGGRVLGVCATGVDIAQAIERAYEACGKIWWQGMLLRRDIGHRALARLKNRPLVGIVMGSPNDWEVMKSAAKALTELGVPHEARVLSAHRTPGQAAQYAASAAERGLKVIIAGAGWAAHLAGAMAAQTVLPVIGVPIGSSQLNGLDALLSTVQMPPGIPVATVAIGAGGARNAGVLAAQILALGDAALAQGLAQQRRDMAAEVAAAEKKLFA